MQEFCHAWRVSDVDFELIQGLVRGKWQHLNKVLHAVISTLCTLLLVCLMESMQDVLGISRTHLRTPALMSFSYMMRCNI